MAASAFELEVGRIAALEGVPAPHVVVGERVAGTAATAASGRRIRLDRRVLAWPDPAQRWLAGHEMHHAIAHGWREPGRWLILTTALVAAGVIVALAWLTSASAAVGLAGVIGLGWLAGVSWWMRRLEAEADTYAAGDGRLAALDEVSLLELLSGDAAIPRWLASHGRWVDRLQLDPERLPAALQDLRSEVEQAQLELTATNRWPVRDIQLLVVRHLPRHRLAHGRWPATVAVASTAVTTPTGALPPELRRALIETHRLPLLRAAVTGAVLSAGLTSAAAWAAGLSPQRSGPLTVTCGSTLLIAGIYEVRRRTFDHKLARTAPGAAPGAPDEDEPTAASSIPWRRPE